MGRIGGEGKMLGEGGGKKEEMEGNVEAISLLCFVN